MTYYGIYKITNLLNGKMYIGQHTTTDLDDGYMGSGIHIVRAVKKYGKENFRKEWLMFCEDQEELNYMEMVFVNQDWIDRSDTYNLTIGGSAPPHGPEWSKIVSEKNSGRKVSVQQKEHLRNINLGKKHSEETKQKMRKAHEGKHYSLGCHHSDEAKKRQSERMKGSGNHFFGKHHSEETKKLIREHNVWYRHSEETKKKIADSSRGNTNNLGKKWYNNGVISRLFNGEPPEGFIEGRIGWHVESLDKKHLISQEDNNI